MCTPRLRRDLKKRRSVTTPSSSTVNRVPSERPERQGTERTVGRSVLDQIRWVDVSVPATGVTAGLAWVSSRAWRAEPRTKSPSHGAREARRGAR